MTNEDVAELMGVQRPTVSTWLGGRRTPSKAVLMLWADMTGVDREWLLTGRPSKYAIRDSNPEPADCVWLAAECPAIRLLPDPRDPRRRSVRPRLTLIWGAAS